MTQQEENWAEASMKARNAIIDMKEAGNAIDIDNEGVAEDVVDMIFDELGFTFRNEDGSSGR